MSTKFEVIGLGASTVDMLSLVDRFPCREEVQEAHEITVQGGGPVATAMVTLARLGARTALLDVIGRDIGAREARLICRASRMSHCAGARPPQATYSLKKPAMRVMP